MADADIPTLEFWYDFASPYSYISAYRIERMISGHSIKLVWRPFLLGPIFKKLSDDASPFQRASPAERRYRRRDIERLCTAYQIPLVWPSNYPRGSLPATRIAMIAANEGWCGAFSRSVYKANYADDLDIADKSVLADVLSSLGRNAVQILEKAETVEVKSELAQQVDRAISTGIFGAPSFLICGELFWGNDRLEQAIAWTRT